ncbi:MAG: shikimate dehydrogenase [Actinobacteria bacterium]|nr:shikimate dehydrogenase [Actinomycetota bacterium]
MATVTSHRIGLVGEGIGSSLSPVVHEAEARALGLAGYRYELLDIHTLRRSPADAATVVREAITAGFTGFNITHPCKQTVMGGLDDLDPHAAALGAVNTVVVDDGRLIGHNTDYSGFLTALRGGLTGAALDTVVLCGAGGAGSAVAHALASAGAQRLIVADADPVRAQGLARQVGRTHPGTDATGVAAADTATHVPGAAGVVNASPIGMEGFAGTPFDTAVLQSRHWVADIVYRPVHTELLRAATALGCRTLDGAQMLVAQAADTFALVTGVEPDRQRMRRHLHEVLRRRAALAS